MTRMQLSETKWKDKLTPEQFKVMRQGATEQAFSGALLHNKATGNYKCAACGMELFESETKFDSGSGWPSFYDVKDTDAVKLKEDRSHGMRRVEITCANCGSHLGHVFQDAPEQPTGLRFCVNSCALDFEEKK